MLARLRYLSLAEAWLRIQKVKTMNVEFTNRGGDGSRKVAPLEDYIKHRLEANSSGGSVECAADNAYSAHYALARLVRLLVSKGVISLQEVGAVVGSPWDGDNLSISEKEQDFFIRR